MALFKRFYNFIVNADLDAYMFDVECFASITDYVHGCGITMKTIYIPECNLYTHYYEDFKKFVVYKSEDKFNEKDEKYSNMKKIKVKARFCFDLMDQYEMDEYQKMFAEKNKDYFNGI
jgi:hypothetical protein